MRKTSYVILGLILVFSFAQISCSAEHGGKEHGGKEHGEATHAEKEHGGKEHGEKEHGGEEHGSQEVSKKPSANEIREAMGDYVIRASAKTGSFNIYDKEARKERRLFLLRVHERVGKTGDYYYSCADFKDLDSGEMLDLDLDVEDKNGELSVVNVRIHKLNGKERYTYDKNDNRIPVSE